MGRFSVRASVVSVVFLMLAGILGITPQADAREDLADASAGPPASIASWQLTLNVSEVGEMTTRNPLPALANDVRTSDVLDRVYDTVLRSDPHTDRLTAYVAKGVDRDEDGTFEPATEYNMWAERAGATTPLEITVYYDFNGVRWHDGVQMTPWDLLFAYHIGAMHPTWSSDLRAVFQAGHSSSYEAGNRQLNITVGAKTWVGEGSLPGDPALRVAITYQLGIPYALFYTGTLAPVLLPMHIWSRTGGGRHADFGCAVWIPPAEASAKGIPECGNADPTTWGRGIAGFETVPGSRPYSYPDAEAWTPADADVIGSGPFRFVSWTAGVEVTLTRNDDYFVGVDDRGTPDPADDIMYDPAIPRYLHRPRIEGIRFFPYANATACVQAVPDGASDFCHASVPTTMVPGLTTDPRIRVWVNGEAGFHYMGYNMRKAPFGYEGNDPTKDVGYWLRKAGAHLADKGYIVRVLLQNYGIEGYGVVSPVNVFWFNTTIPGPDYNLTEARRILDSPEAAAVGIGADPPGACANTTPSGCRMLPGIGNASFEIVTPNMTYDPVRAIAGEMIAQAMRDVGVNAVAFPVPFANLTERLAARDFDLYILGWRISGMDPDYLFAFFHSSNAESGQNFPGVNSTALDRLLEAQRVEIDRDVRRQYVFDAQGVIADLRPYEVLYYRANIEAQRQDRFVNWSISSGSIWNYWSLIGIRPPVFRITVDTSPPNLDLLVNGVPVQAPFSVDCVSGDHVAVEAQDQVVLSTRYVFQSWSDGGARAHDVVCDASRTVTASFQTQYLIVVDTSPPGLDVVVNGMRALAPVTFWCEAGLAVPIEAPAQMSIPETRIYFIRWSDGGAQAHTIQCDGPGTYIAYYGIEHQVFLSSTPLGLTLEVDGVPVTTPYVVVCPDGSAVTISVPSPQGGGGTRHQFVSWGDGAPRNRTVACSPGSTYGATFTTEHEVTVLTAPAGLEVVVGGTASTSPVVQWCPAGSTLSVDVTTPQGSGDVRYVFAGWSDGGARAHQIPCDAPGTYTATFTVEYRVSLDTSPTGLALEVGGQTVTAPHAFWCPAGTGPTVVALSPQGAGDSRQAFSSWTDGGGASHAIDCDGPKAATADFVTEFRITIATSPSGLQVSVDGAPVSAPYVLWCPSGSTVEVDASGTRQIGEAQYEFASWSDGAAARHAIGCAGPLTVTATFAAVPPSFPVVYVIAGVIVAVTAIAVGVALLLRRRRAREPGGGEPEDAERRPPPQ